MLAPDCTPVRADCVETSAWMSSAASAAGAAWAEEVANDPAAASGTALGLGCRGLWR